MTTTAFTPGPWRVEEGTTFIWGACNPEDRTTYGMGYPVTQARVRLGSATEYASEFREDEAEANAHLIAAAPDLYEALLSAREQILQLANARWSEVEASDAELTADIDRALAKARGEA